jgi:nitrite reductase/ring-hydroxylating ferredoxin subunit
VRLLGEIVLFRDEHGRYRLIERACPHRGTDLAFGRLEDGGLRCAFHGWLFDVTGRCLETPAEPADSRLAANIRQKAYPVVERSGILFAYLGPGEPPDFPLFDCFVAPATHTFAFKGRIDCNWLQSLGSASIGAHLVPASLLPRQGPQARLRQALSRRLDRFANPDDAARAPARRSRSADRLRHAHHARIDDANTRARHQSRVPARLRHPMSSEMTITQWHVPIDDTRHYWYAIFTSFGAGVDKDEMRRQRLQLYELPDYVPRKNKGNDYGFNPHEQVNDTYTGMGADINVHDQWACESMGAIADRTREHLGQSDKAISAYRRLLRGAIEQAGNGGTPPMVLDPPAAARLTGPPAIDGIGPSDDWQAYWRATDAARRRASSWANGRQGL